MPIPFGQSRSHSFKVVIFCIILALGAALGWILYAYKKGDVGFTKAEVRVKVSLNDYNYAIKSCGSHDGLVALHVITVRNGGMRYEAGCKDTVTVVWKK